MRRAFGEARNAAPERTREAWFAVADRPVRLRVVGDRLAAESARPFAHLACSRSATGCLLAIDLWDAADAGVSLPRVRETDLPMRWETRGGIFSASPDGRYVAFTYGDSLTLLDRSAATVVGCRAPGGHLAKNAWSKPLILQLSVWCHDVGVHVVHAGLVARGDLGVLLPGRGGIGKSTAAIACLDRGFDYVGDDFVGLEERASGDFVGHSLFGSACLRSHDLARFPRLRASAIAPSYPEEYKATLFLAERCPTQLRAQSPIRAIALPQVVDAEDTTIRRAGKSEALRRLAPGTFVNVVPRPGRETLERMARLVERVPSYWLLLGRDRAQIPERVDALVQEATR